MTNGKEAEEEAEGGVLYLSGSFSSPAQIRDVQTAVEGLTTSRRSRPKALVSLGFGKGRGMDSLEFQDGIGPAGWRLIVSLLLPRLAVGTPRSYFSPNTGHPERCLCAQ